MLANFKEINSMMNANSMVLDYVKGYCLKIQHIEGFKNYEDLKK